MHTAEFSDLVLRLTSSAVESPPAEHQARMITLLREVIGFDAAWWGWSCFAGDRISMLNCTLHGLPDSFDAAARAVQGVDPFVRHGRNLPVYAIALRPDADAVSPRYRAFAERFGISAMMNGHCRMERESPYNFFMSLYRTQARPAFSHDETQDFRQILRHLEQSLSLTLRADLRARAGAQGQAALLDGAGRVIRATRGFDGALDTQDLAPRTRAALLRRLAAQPGDWQGTGIAARSEPYAQGLSVIRLFRPGQWDLLSPRERAVAAGLLRGESSRSIAGWLQTSPNTVRNQIAAIYRKLGISSRVQLAGVLDPQD